MKKLFLCSSFKDVSNIFEQFVKDMKGKTVTFIPTASIVEKVVFYVKSGRKALEKLGLVVDELEISTASYEEITNKLTKNDYIYISGGNTFFLLQALKKSGADKIIIEQVSNGKLYIGESAGIMVTAPNIEYAGKLDSVKKATGLENFAGLELVDFYPLPHHTNATFKKSVEKAIEQYGQTLKLYPISNSEAILVENDAVKVESNA